MAGPAISTSAAPDPESRTAASGTATGTPATGTPAPETLATETLATETLAPETLATKYDPASVEGPTYERWLEQGVFRADPTSGKPPFAIVIPPPNVTG